MALLAVVGCGDEETDALIGSWTADIPPAVSVAFSFDIYGEYTLSVVRAEPGLGKGQIEKGRFNRATSTVLNMYPARWSCPEALTPYGLGYSLQQNALSVQFSDTVVNLRRSPPPAAAFTVGCFAEDGSFTEHKLQ